MLQATIDRFEENYAVVAFDNGDILNISIDELPEGAEEGAVLYFHPTIEPEAGNDREALAKTILNTILKKNT